ncbi:MAG TPA: glycosyltransferase, partial [Stellaceae bacterium]|nr:glycosyltransferase [Stellaceae bacterium]
RRETCAGYIEPADGTEDYRVDPAAAGELPLKIQNLVRPAPVTAEPIVTIRNTYPPRPNGMLGDLRLIHLAWEESALPAPLVDQINLHADGVLVPSQFSKSVIRNSGVRLPIAIIGHGVDHSGPLPRPIGDRAKRGPVTHALPFTFLHVSSGLARKGIEELITAYCLAFSRHDPVLLVIKTFDNPTNVIDIFVERLTGRCKFSPAIQVIAEELGRRELDFLYHSADAMILPSRGEGFNLPAAEAMARGLPVIVTRHSGHLDFCNDENSCLIDGRYEFSTSHLKIPNSFWLVPSIEQLVRAMKAAYRAGRAPGTIAARRAANGQRDALRLRWREVAERVDDFVGYLDKRPVMTRKLRLGWVSTYNARCGIATHSEHLLEFFDKDAFAITILADDQAAIAPDPDNVQRLWSKGGGLGRVRGYLITNRFDAVLLQHNFSFYDPNDFADTVIALADESINTFVILHRTSGIDDQRHRLVQALQSCARVFVHSLEDVNRLREWGVTDNVALLAHGVIDRAPLNADAVRGLLGLADCRPVIGSFGFLLPGKGLVELIYAFALISRAHPAAHLLMLNADYPTPESRQERERCLALIRLLELEGRLHLVSEFLETDEMLFLLGACDVIVFPYQRSEESASGAVRLGLAAGRPVLTTPLPIFADLAEIICQLPGSEPTEIAEGIRSLLADEDRKAAVLQRQREWVRANSWSAQAARLANIIQGCFEEAHGVELRPPRRMPPLRRDDQRRGESGLLEEHLATAQKLLERPVVASPASAPARLGPKPARARPGLLRRLGSPTPRPSPKPQSAEKAFLSRADRARDARDWASA